MKQVEKIHIAVEELEDALKAYFERRFHSALVLAAAAEQLLAGYVMKHGLTPAWANTRMVVTKIANGLKIDGDTYEKATTKKEIGDLMNRAYNHSKHAGTSDHTQWMDPKDEAHMAIDRAISNYDVLDAQGIYDLQDMPLAQRFVTESIANVRAEE